MSRGLGDVYKRQAFTSPELHPAPAEPEAEPEKHGLSAFWHKVFG